MRTYKIEGIVLKRRNLGEADRVLTILSRESGKIIVKAPGVRRIKSRRSPHVELLNLSQFTLYKSSRTFMPIVTEAQTLEDFSPIKSDLHKIGLSLYICELINGLCADNQENRDAFFLLKNVLTKLSIEESSSELVSCFEKELLRTLGFWREAELLETPTSAKASTFANASADKSAGKQDSRTVMERLLERKLKTLRVIPLFAS
ncbi:MAG: repair protein RecO protein [Candidatus Levybacteria bacterium GW2011_GWA2_37_36]|nr:MAG: repair protein RecO protein [Candidatus Levybacteria bacterium GW2011_GWA1_37_16]KKQ34066.1 MAG: repair protein RecO protein [Candidatus Levybacteria bacterium GW2011_GWA2_37_36]KKQ38258.1 MAG: repair protein RecO protein [Candidatus Levybacteria bacterium GW2011_GWC2_37_7]KKQ42329.1 MAG: repair protein RecO protein [Candidatus Levybacteria bacterium GW2011_GWB1_37_8]OGH51075.1 MAG: DNA repair protein RecO [Candidatus Levybacteria bacterium RIFCSPLOWO2_12_FULL_37_14]